MRKDRLASIIASAIGAVLTAPCAVHALETIDVSAPLIVPASAATDMEKLAATEFLRYLYVGSGKLGVIARNEAVPERAAKPVILLDVAGNNRQAAAIEKREGIPVDLRTLGEEGFRWKVTRCRENPALLIAAASPLGVLRGVYALLEKLGFGFYLGGDTRPAPGTPMTLPASLDEVRKPVFAVRGSLPWPNFLNAPTCWDLEDYKYFFDQMSKQGFNFVGIPNYGRPFCAYEQNGTFVLDKPLVTSLNYRWGCVRGLRTEQFGFGTGDYFDRDPFASRRVLDAKDRNDGIRRSQRMLAQAMRYAHTRGIKFCLGWELKGDPTDPEGVEQTEAKIAAFVRTYPKIDYIWFWQSEGLGQVRRVKQTAKGSPLEALIRAQADTFGYLEPPKRIHEAVRISYFFNTAYRIVRKYRPDLPVIVSGWGGDQWMRFTDFYVGLDRTLPRDVIFAALDNIDPAQAPHVSKVYGELPLDRQRWPIPWWESDGGGNRRDQWGPQCNVKPFTALCRDALAKKCQGLIGIHWRTRDVEEVAAYQARFAWNPSLSYKAFYDAFARRSFGRRWAESTSRILRELEALGPRWTGALGQPECAGFSWFTGRTFPQKRNLRKLAEHRAELAQIREWMLADGRLQGIERIEWLLTTIDWLSRYDKAALKLYRNGPVQTALRQAEAAKARGDNALAEEKAKTALDAMRTSGFKEAIQTFPRKMSTMGEFGTLATIEVKAYAAYLDLRDRVKAILGELPDTLGGPPVPEGTPPFIVGRQPSSSLEAGRALPVGAVVMGAEPITSCILRYRKLGAEKWKSLRMSNSFRRTYTAVIPPQKRDDLGVEWFVTATDQSKRVAHWPKGYPTVVWSASITPHGSP